MADITSKGNSPDQKTEAGQNFQDTLRRPINFSVETRVGQAILVWKLQGPVQILKQSYLTHYVSPDKPPLCYYKSHHLQSHSSFPLLEYYHSFS